MRRRGLFVVAVATAAAAAATPSTWQAATTEGPCVRHSADAAAAAATGRLAHVPHRHATVHRPPGAASPRTLAAAAVRRVAGSAVTAAASSRATQAPVRCCTSSPSSDLSLTQSPAHQAPARHGNSDVDGGAAYDEERHIEGAEAALREVFGPLAKLVLHRITQRRHTSTAAADGDDDGEDGDGAGLPATPDAGNAGATGDLGSGKARPQSTPQQGHYYRAAATFRLLGFPVELASVKGRRAKETIEACLHQALSSDVAFIHTGRGGPRHNAGHQRGGRGGRAFGRQRGGGGGRAGQQQNASQSTAGGLANRSGFSARGMGHGGPGRLTPHQVEFKAIMDDLRKLCAHFSRTVKFSVKPPVQQPTQQRRSDTDAAAAAATTEGAAEAMTASRAWRCRCYVKEEWGTSPQARLAHEALGSSPNDALVRCVTQLRQQYWDEMNSAAVMQEGVHEVAALMQGQHKTVRATWQEEAASLAAGSPETFTADEGAALLHSGGLSTALGQPATFSAQLQLTDKSGNVSTYHARRQTSPYVGFQTAAGSAIRAEWAWDRDAHLLSQRLAAPPLLWRLRWQFDMMVDHICRETGRQASDVAWIQISGTGLGERGDAGAGSGSGEVGRAVETEPSADDVAQPTALHNQPVVSLPGLLTGSVNAEGDTVVWQAAGAGRYRIELDTYVHALYYLLDQYGDSLASLPCMANGLGEGLLFPSAAVLDLQVARHDAFPILQQHRGKWTCYAVLGTLTQQLLGCAYNTHYGLDPVRKEWVCTLTVHNGRQSSFPLAQGRSKQKGESWRHACLSAFRENFPRQYAAVLEKYPDVDLSQDTGARGSRFRDLPREKRVAHVTSFGAMVLTFLEEDLGWRQPRIRLRNLSVDIGLPQWVAELEVQVEGEDGRRVVAVSPSFTQAKIARRSLLYRVAIQYLPKEVEWYRNLGRSDGDNPEDELGQHRTRLYNPGLGVDTSMLGHVISLMERGNATMAPIKVTLEGRVRLPPPSEGDDGIDGEGDEDGGTDAVDCGLADGDASLALCQQPEILLRPFNLLYHAQVLGDGGNVLIADYDSDTATAPADAAAVPVLVTALKSASVHIAGADAETLWTEYETYPKTGLSNHRDLAISLFTTFFGANATADDTTPSPSISPLDERDTAAGAVEWFGSNSDPNAVVSAVTAFVGRYWFTTVVLPRFGMLPIARAVAQTKRRSVRDAIALAARRSFPRLLHYYAKHEGPCTALATEVLTLSVVENLPEAAVRDVKALLQKTRASRPLPPVRLLLRSIQREHPLRDHRLRMQHSYDTANGHQYRLYLQRGQLSRLGASQLVGYGASPTSPTEALDRASLLALENLFEAELRAAERAQPGYSTPQFWNTQKP